MSIAKHVNSLQKHLAQFGLYPVHEDPITEAAANVFKICFLNKYEMERWQELREEEDNRKQQKDKDQS